MEIFIANHKGEIAALFTAVCWTFTSLAFESAGKKVGSLSVNLIRLVIAFIFLGTYTLWADGHFLPWAMNTHAWLWLSISGLVGFLFGDLLLFQAFVVTGARVSMLIMSISPPLTALFGWIILGETLSWSNILGMTITIWGISIVVLSRSSGNKKVHLHYPVKGILLALGGAAGQGLGLVLSKLGMQDMDPFASTQIRVIAGIVGFALLFTVTGRWQNVFTALKNGMAMVGITIGAFFGPFLGVSLSLYAIQFTTTGIAATLNSLTPIIIIPFARLFFKEPITTKEIVGSAIAVMGVTVFFIF